MLKVHNFIVKNIYVINRHHNQCPITPFLAWFCSQFHRLQFVWYLKSTQKQYLNFISLVIAKFEASHTECLGMFLASSFVAFITMNRCLPVISSWTHTAPCTLLYWFINEHFRRLTLSGYGSFIYPSKFLCK
jgi:hypothetical protein